MIWSVDGVEWDIPCQVERAVELQATDISGFMLNGEYFNDVMGTYMRYDVAIAVPLGMRDEYYSVFELLSAPVNKHDFVMPYNGGTIPIEGRVEDLSDAYVYMDEGNNWWKGVRFSVVANKPTKWMSFDEFEQSGMPTPLVSEAVEGDLYEYTENGWQQASYQDADGEYF